jgi:hypothetical protein
MAHDNFKAGWSQGPGVCGAGSEDEWINIDANEFMWLISKTGFVNVFVNEAGCGDLFWLRNHHAFFECWVDYHGYELQDREVHPNCTNLTYTPNFDITREVMRSCNVIMSRLVFIHLPNKMISDALNRFRMTGAKYLVASYVPSVNNEGRHEAPSYHRSDYDLTQAPFNLKLVSATSRNALFEL